MTIKVKIKKLSPDAIIPAYATAGAACFDLCAIGLPDEGVSVKHGSPVSFKTGLAVEIPEGHVLMIHSRSGHGFKHSSRLSNVVGVLDQDYRGEVVVRLSRDISGSDTVLHVKNGDRIAQAMVLPYPKVEFEVVEELTETARGEGGFGSTGR